MSKLKQNKKQEKVMMSFEEEGRIVMKSLLSKHLTFGEPEV